MAAAALATTSIGIGSASATDGHVMGHMTVGTWYTQGGLSSLNSHAGYHYFFGANNGTISGGIKVRWVKCGYTSTQDGASSVGGDARTVGASGTLGVVLGTNFRSGSCVRAWARGISNSGDFGYEDYFNDRGLG